MTRTRALLAGVLTAAACATASCALANGTTPTPTPPPNVASPTTSAPSPTPAPSSASVTPTPKPDKVTQAVYRYHRVLDELGKKPPRDPYKKLFTITRDEEFDMWQDVMIRQSFDGEYQVGDTRVMSVKHGAITKKSGEQRVVVKVCVDVSGVDVRNQKGKSVVAKDRPDHAAEQLWMITEDGAWYVSKSRDGSWKC